MASAESEYLEKRRQQIAKKQRIVTYISLFSFGGSILFGGFNTIKQAWEQPQQKQQEQAITAETELQKQIKGYELVLQREPNNRIALEKLSIIRLKAGDNKGAIALMEKLVKLYPDRQDYQTVLADVKKKTGEGSQASKVENR